MADTINTNPSKNELPSDYADRLGIYYSNQVTKSYKKENGQFFTPTPIAHLMASFCDLKNKELKILDPGCGTAILTCALIEHLSKQKPKTEFIELIAYETDPQLISFSDKVLNYLKKWLELKEIDFKYILHIHDFIFDNAKALLKEEKNHENYDVIISNPPYFKLPKNDRKTIIAKELVSGQANIYSLFMGIASKLLNENGELIFLTPRSFASGNYFKAFRELFFNSVQIDKIHLFNSRKDTFSRDSVLQETLVVKAIKSSINPNKQVTVSSSIGIKDIYNPNIKYFASSELIDLSSKEKILHLPTNDKEESILRLVTSWENKLNNYDIHISTGPVVAFRAWNFIKNEYENSSVFLAPLFWLHNVNKMYLEWPVNLKNKGQYIKIESTSKSLLIPNKDYILLRRFSTKDDKSRLIAAPYFSNYIKSNFIAVENKVNYIYRKNGHLERNEVVGLCSLLNSDLFDIYFQIFNGNVNVSATELREMRLPPINDIKNIGNKIILSNDFSVKNVNKTINEFFELEVILQ